jgi:hypothetical protein
MAKTAETRLLVFLIKSAESNRAAPFSFALFFCFALEFPAFHVICPRFGIFYN